jgi:hypothetical protein
VAGSVGAASAVAAAALAAAFDVRVRGTAVMVDIR